VDASVPDRPPHPEKVRTAPANASNTNMLPQTVFDFFRAASCFLPDFLNSSCLSMFAVDLDIELLINKTFALKHYHCHSTLDGLWFTDN
jgi:hypothetical protein